jgi:hypothetical protein
MVGMVKTKEEIIQEALRRYEDPVERGAFVLGYVTTAYAEKGVRRLKEAVGPHLERREAWAVRAFKEGSKQALWDIFEKVRPDPEELRELRSLVKERELSVSEAVLLLRARKNPQAAQGRERLLRAIQDKVRGRAKA